MKKIYYLLFKFLLVSSFIYSQDDQKQLYQDLDKEIKTARKAYYKKLKSENDSTRLEVYSVRKQSSEQKFLDNKEEAIVKQVITKKERKNLQKNIADSRRAKRIELSNEIEQIKITRDNYREVEANKRSELKENLQLKNEKKLNERSKKKKRDYTNRKQIYKDKIDKRRELVLARYSIN